MAFVSLTEPIVSGVFEERAFLITLVEFWDSTCEEALPPFSPGVPGNLFACQCTRPGSGIPMSVVYRSKEPAYNDMDEVYE